MLSLGQWDPLEVVRSGVHRIWTDQTVILPLLDDMGTPARHAAHSKKRRELVNRDAALVQGNRRIVIHIWDELALCEVGFSHCLVFQTRGNVVPAVLPRTFSQLLRLLLHDKHS